MKSHVKRLTEAYPIKDLENGWFFRLVEIANGVYEIEGIDHRGRKVSRTGTNPDEILKTCAKDARELSANKGK
jgi:hypothetical protein